MNLVTKLLLTSLASMYLLLVLAIAGFSIYFIIKKLRPKKRRHLKLVKSPKKDC
jgi:hypothetical protein